MVNKANDVRYITTGLPDVAPVPDALARVSPTKQRAWVQPEVEKRYQQYMQDCHGELDIERLCSVMWNAGGRHAIMAMTQFGDILPMIGRIESRIVNLRSLLEQMTGADH